MNNNIQEDYCSFEVSKLLKEIGFNVVCDTYYENNSFHNCVAGTAHWNSECLHVEHDVSAPTHALAIKWIRENFKVHIWLENNAFGYYWSTNNASELPWEGDKRARMGDTNMNLCNYPEKEYKTPEQATEAALLYTLKHLI